MGFSFYCETEELKGAATINFDPVTEIGGESKFDWANMAASRIDRLFSGGKKARPCGWVGGANGVVW